MRANDNKSESSMDELVNINLIQVINESEKQVIGSVKGILKKLNKTYGGSIIN